MSITPRSFRTSCPIIKVPVPVGHTLASLKKLYPRCPECDRNWPKTPDDDSKSCRSRVSSVSMRMHTTSGVSASTVNRSKSPAPWESPSSVNRKSPAPWESPSSVNRNKSPATRKPTGIPSKTRSYPPRHSCCAENDDPTSDLDAASTNRPNRRISSVTKPNYGAMRNLKPNETYSLIEPNEVNAYCQDSAESLDNPGLDEPCCSHEPSFWWRFRSFFKRKHKNKRRGRRASVTWSRSPSICYIPDK